MKRLFFIFLSISFICVFAQTSTSSSATTTDAPTAAELASTTLSIPSHSKAILLANVEIGGAALTSLPDKTYIGSFSVTNRGETQDGANYRFLLLNGEGSVVSTQAFERTIALLKNVPVSVSEKVLIPQGLDGTYSVQAQVLTSTGVPLASAILNTVTLHEKATSSLSSCVIAKPSFKKSEVPTLACTVTGAPSKEGAIGVRLFYGNEPKIIQATSTQAVKGKNTVSISPLSLPGNYIARISLYENGSPSGEEKSALFTVEGTHAMLTTVALDKNFYKEGDTAQATFSVSVFSSGTTTALFAITDVVGKSGPCTSGTKDTIGPTAFSISIPVIKECTDPTLTVQIVDTDGTIYDKKTMSLISPAVVKTMQPIETPSHSPLIYALGGIALLLALGGAGYFAYIRMKKIALPVSSAAIASTVPFMPATSPSIPAQEPVAPSVLEEKPVQASSLSPEIHPEPEINSDTAPQSKNAEGKQA